MDHIDSTSRTRLGDDPDVIKYTTEYVRRLLAEAAYVYAAIENQGGSVILTNTGLVNSDRTFDYSSQIGNQFHLDLIELQQLMDTVCSKGEKDALIAWANGLTQSQAAIYLQSTGGIKVKGATLRKRRERGIHDLTDNMNEGQDPRTTRENRNIPIDALGKTIEHSTRFWPAKAWHLERKKNGESV